MEQTDSVYRDQSTSGGDNYWPSVLLVGGIFALIAFIINIAFGYIQIGSEPSGSFFSPLMLSGVVVCLATCVGGLIAVWHYTKDVTAHLKLGRGALIGFITGAIIAVFSAVLNELWLMVDPEYTQKLVDSVVANIEAMDLPADTRDQMIDQMAAGLQDTSFFQQLFMGIPVTGLLNLLTGMLGVKLFAAKEEEVF
jgi:hypothetical protein